MRRSLYAVLQDTQVAAADLRSELTLDPDLETRLARFEIAIEHAMASSPDKQHVAHAEEYVALDALCDLHLALQDRPEDVRNRLRPIVDEWIAYAASTGLTPQELAAQRAANPVDRWLGSAD